jgi:outer membrane protein assembly factor BamD (BamD/ComL family)
LGLTAFEQEGDFTGAARWFETYLAEQADGNLRREAAGRAMEAWQRAGARDRARAAALEYLRQYPNGVQAPLARRLAMSP